MGASHESALRWFLAILGAVCVGVLWLSFRFTPAEVSLGAVQEMFGVEVKDCPGCALCGLSRAFSAASHGEWRVAGELNRLFYPAYSLTWLFALSGTWALSRLLRRDR